MQVRKILLSAHCKTSEQKYIAQALLEIVLSKGYNVDVMANVDLGIQQESVQTVSPGNLQTKDYAVILACNLKGYHCIRHLAKTIPVIYIVKQEDCVKEFLYGVSLVSRFLIVSDGDELSHQIFPGDCSTQIPYPYLPQRQNLAVTDLSANILVATDDKTLLKTIPVFNNYTKYNFVIVTEISSIVKKIVNANCTVVSAKRTNLLDFIKGAALVIGCGKPILTSIGCGKPAIVAGKFGFGRRVTPENLEEHLHSFFKGRLGARGEEIIPFHLLSHEIDSCMNSKPEDNKVIAKSLIDFLFVKQEQTVALIDSLICSVGASKSALYIRLRVSTLYRFIAFGESSWLVVDERMLKAHAMIDRDEYELIHSFRDGVTVSSVMQNNLYHKTPKQLISFIEYLVAYKFLVPYDKEANF
jgi:hypothetical protein